MSNQITIQLAPLSVPSWTATPRATHVSTPDTLPYSDSEYDSDSDTDEWFKKNDEYKQMQKDELVKPVLVRSTNLMGKQEKEPDNILPLV